MKKTNILVLLLLALTLSACSPYAKEHKKYIEEHTVNISNDFNTILDSYDTNFDAYDVYLVGELHGIKETFELDIAFTKYLHEKQNVRNILIEIGFADGQLINMYMATGNEEYLKGMFSNYKGTFAYSNNNFQMYKDLYAFNQTLDEGEKITFFGIDVQHQVHTGLYYLNLLLPDSDIPSSIEAVINDLKGCMTPNSKWWDISQALKEKLEINEADTRSYLGAAFDDFVFALDSIYQSAEYYNFAENAEKYREEMLASNFTSLYERFNEGKIIGFFGSAHTSLISEGIDRISFAETLNTKLEITKNKVASIYLSYPKGIGMGKKEGTTSKVSEDHLTKWLRKKVAFDLGFCRLDFANSPFNNGHQYIVVVKKAQPATRYNLD